jgi:hypothetical protein
MDVKGLLIGALIVTVVVLGYLYYESQKNTVEVDIGAAQPEAPISLAETCSGIVLQSARRSV